MKKQLNSYSCDEVYLIGETLEILHFVTTLKTCFYPW